MCRLFFLSLALLMSWTWSLALVRAAPDPAPGDTGAEVPAVYRWRDPRGVLHFSNRAVRVPTFAERVELPPPNAAPATARVRADETRSRSGAAVVAARPARRSHLGACGTPDASGVIDAVATRLARTRQLDTLTLFVAGVPVAYSPDTLITRLPPRDDADGGVGVVEQAALAYPGRGACPERPPLERYPIASERRTAARRMCDDYQRAFAEVGVAVSRNQGVARTFRAVAEDFTDVARRGYVAGYASDTPAIEFRPGAVEPIRTSPPPNVALPPWAVEAHVAQSAELAGEASGFVDELTAALEEIDRVARARGCW